MSTDADRKTIFETSKIAEVDRNIICEWAVEELWSGSPDCDEALNYLRTRRRLSEDVINRFQIGYVPKEARHDLAGRLIMPLFDHHNRLVCLTTRDFREGAGMPHWHESFDKGRYLFGGHLAKRAILKHNKVLVIEGQFDDLALHDHGLDIAVCALGGALTYQHVCILRRYCTDFYIWFDPDKAGWAATERALLMYEERGLGGFGINFVPVCTDDDRDPDDFVIEQGKSGVIELMKESKKKAQGKYYAPSL